MHNSPAPQIGQYFYGYEGSMEHFGKSWPTMRCSSIVFLTKHWNFGQHCWRRKIRKSEILKHLATAVGSTHISSNLPSTADSYSFCRVCVIKRRHLTSSVFFSFKYFKDLSIAVFYPCIGLWLIQCRLMELPITSDYLTTVCSSTMVSKLSK